MDHEFRARILIVEDDPDIAQLLQRVFHLGGYATTWAENGLRALELLAAAPPDLVTLDMNMPRVSGVEVLEVIRSAPALAELPVIVLTSREELPSQVHARASAVMHKPFDVTALLYAAGSLLAAVPQRSRAVGA